MSADRRLPEIEQELRESIATGTPVDLRSGSPEADDPASYAAWQEWRNVPATLLIELLTEHAVGQRRPRALWLAGARITEEFDLRDAELLCPLLLLGCWFDEPVIFSEAQAVTVRLTGCRLPGLEAGQLVTRGNLELNAGFSTEGGVVDLLGAHVGGFLNFSGAILSNSDGPALFADQLTVTKSMICRNGFTAYGGVRLASAHIGGDLDFSGATVIEPEDRRNPALFADKVTVAQSMFCGDAFTAHGEVNLVGAQIGSNLEFIGATLNNRGGRALWADQLTVGQRMMCEAEETIDEAMIWRKPFTAHGEMNLLGAHIGSTLSFTGANLSNPDGFALTADHLTVTQSMVCRDEFTAEGEVRLPNAHIGGNLEFNGATLTNLDGCALQADRLRVDESMLCRDGFTAEGKVRLVGAHIGGQLQLDGATLITPEGPAISLNLETADVGTLILRPAAAPRRVNLALARVGALADDQTKPGSTDA